MALSFPTHDLVQLILNKNPDTDYYLSLLIRRMDGVFNYSAMSSLQRTVCGFPRKISKSSIMMEWNDCKESMIIKCILLVAIILDSFEVISHFGEKARNLLQAMYKLAKSFHQLKDYPILFKLHEVIEKNGEANPGLSTIVDASFSCFVQNIDSKYDRLVLNPSAHRNVIKKYQSLIDQAYIDLVTQTLVFILRSQQRRFPSDAGGGNAESAEEVQPAEGKRPEEITESSNQAAKPGDKQGGDEKDQTESGIKSVIKKLDLVKMKEKRVAVVIQGDSSESKTMIADDAYDRVEAELLFRGWKLCAQKIPESLEFNPNVKEMRSYIVDLLATGKERKKSRIIHQVPVFIFIDNILRAQDLTKILDMRLMRRMNVRLLVTSANRNLKSMLKDELGFHYEEVEAHKSGEGYHQDVDDDFKGYPIFPEMVEYYDRTRTRGRQAAENIRGWAELVVKGDLMGTAFNFASEIAFLNLPATARDAFLDICNFFLGWDWNEILLILGEAELETLEENAFVKRNGENQTTVSQALLHLFRNRAKGGRFTNRDELQKALSSSEEIKGIWVEDAKDEQVLEIPFARVSDTLRVLSVGRGTAMKVEKPHSFKKLRFLQVGKSAEQFLLNDNRLNHNLNYFDCGKEDFALDPSKLPGGLKILKLGGDAEVVYHRPSSLHDSDEWIEWELQKLKLLSVKNFEKLGIPDPRLLRPFDKLRELSIQSCTVLEIPESLTQMNFLQKLDLHDCKYLRKLPESFGALVCLEELNLSYCSSLRGLPKSFGQLQSLKGLVLSYCSALKHLPSSFVWLSRLKKAVFSNCHHIQTLPEKFELLTSLEEVDLSYCKRLKSLPANFHLLSSMNLLNLHGCSKLEKLPYSFPESLVKSKSVAIKLSGCSSLSELPDEFCEGNMIEHLSLAYCTFLNKLPSHISELRQLKMLNLSHCIYLPRLPGRFIELECLEVLNLSFCESLRNLCEGFNRLKALKHINLSNCPLLKGKWMYILQRMKSLRVVDIRGRSPQLTPKGRYHFTVLSDELKQDKEILQNVLNETSSNFFKDKVSLLSLDGRPFFPSKDIAPGTLVAFIFYHNISRWDWAMLEENVDKGLRNLLERQVIYVGRSLSALPPKMVDKLAAYTPDYSKALLLFDRCLSVSAAQSPDFWEFGMHIVETKVVKNPKELKQFEDWKCTSHTLMGKDFNIVKYRLLEDSISEKNDRSGTQSLLQQLLMTKELERLPMEIKASAETGENMEPNSIQAAIGRNKVSIGDLQQSIVFLLISTLEISRAQISFLEEMYKGMQKSHVVSGDRPISWIWVPVALPEKQVWESKYKTVTERMPWVVISDPWMLEQSTVTMFFRERMGFYGIPVLVSLAPWGPFSTTNVIPMVTTIGSNAWLFLKKNHLSDSSYNVLSQVDYQSDHLAVLFEHVEGLKEKLSNRKMVWLYGGDPKKIGEFHKKMKSVRENIDRKSGIHILYVGRGRCVLDANSREKEAGLHKEIENQVALYKASDKLSWSILSLDNMKKFWHQIHYFLFLVASVEYKEEKIESIQRLLLALLSLDCLSRRNGTLWMMAIDYNKRNLLTGRGKELVETLASNIEMSRKSSVEIANGVVEVLTKEEGKERPWIEFQVKDTDTPLVETKEGNIQRFEDALWLTAHPSSQIVEQVSANNCCSMCFDRDPAYQCDRCGCFSICQKCYISHFIGRISRYVGMQKGERAGEMTVEVGQHYTS